MNPIMSLNAVLWAFGIASMFTLWAPVGKISGLPSAWIALLALTGSMIGGGVPALWNINTSAAVDPKFILLLFLLGAVNGIGMYFYPIKVTDPAIPAAAFMTIVIVAMVIMTALFTCLLTWQLPSLRLVIGIGVMIAGIVIAIA